MDAAVHQTPLVRAPPLDHPIKLEPKNSTTRGYVQSPNNLAQSYLYNEFQDIERIGTGGFGEVYRANWENSNTVVALKSLKTDDCYMKKITNEVYKFNDYLVFYFPIVIY